MRLLLVDNWIHFKNRDSILKMCQKLGIELAITKNEDVYKEEWDLVFIPSGILNSALFPNAKKIIYGPHNFVFLEEPWISHSYLFDNRCVYNFLSDWVLNMEREIGNFALRPVTVPFPVDTDKFCPLVSNVKEYDCFIYFKQRKIELLNYVKAIVEERGYTYKIIQYGKYKEEDFIDIVRKSKFGIWIGTHESQGFALQESLSMGTPLLVLNTTTMFDSVGNNNEYNFQDKKGRYILRANVAPYFDEKCGIIIDGSNIMNDFTNYLEKMMESYKIFSPRQYILETLSYEVSCEKFINC